MKRQTFSDIVAYSFFLLFVYTSFNKLFNFDFYLGDLKRSPELGPYALILSILIPLSELAIAAIILPLKTRKQGLLGALILMILFTLYVAYVVFFASYHPCSCGGIIRELTWMQHLIFNISFVLLAIVALIFERNKRVDNYAL